MRARRKTLAETESRREEKDETMHEIRDGKGGKHFAAGRYPISRRNLDGVLSLTEEGKVLSPA